MLKRAALSIGCLLLLCGSAMGDGAVRVARQPTQPAAAQPAAPSTAIKIDPEVFFQRLVDRYRGLHLYKDVVTVVQVMQRDGAETGRVESKFTCEVSDGKLVVQTPLSQVKRELGLNLPLGRDVDQQQRGKDAQQKSDLWLAPHMTLKFTDKPLKDMRAGVNDGFTATDAHAVTIDNKPMIHVELRGGCATSADGKIIGEDCTARFDLYVNSDSMLIERIEGEQKLPDGASYSTTLQITPEQAEGATSSTPPPANAPPV